MKLLLITINPSDLGFRKKKRAGPQHFQHPGSFYLRPATAGWIINKLFADVLFNVISATAECSKTHWKL